MRKLVFTISILTILLLIASSAMANTYMAFSFKNARDQLKQQRGMAETLSSVGITRPIALVYDSENDDIILVGKREKGRKSVTHDDWVVAVRAILKNKIDPAVSIDVTKETKTTGKQKVRFEGGLENTQFGQDLLDADIVLKRLGLGTESAEIFGLESYLNLSATEYRDTGNKNKIVSRFWFHPEKSSSYVTAKNGVVVVEDYKIGVKNQIIGSDNLKRDYAAEKFASDLRNNYPDIKLYYKKLGRLEQLYYIAALSQGLQSSGMTDSALIPYWLNDYKVAYVPTRREYPLEENSADVKDITIEVSGGISLDTLVVDLEDGVADTIKNYVIGIRPNRNAITWEVPLLKLAWGNDQDSDKLAKLVNSGSRKFNGGMSIQRSYRTRIQSISSAPTFTNLNIRAPSPMSNPVSTSFLNNFQNQRPIRSPKVGGVMLSGVAKLAGAGPAKVDLSGGNFSFVVDGKNARLSPGVFRKFITALWTVYYSNQDPGISIDPIAPGINKHLVRYIGKVLNTDLGRVMRDADYLMKKWSVGTARPDISDFKNPDDYAAEQRVVYLAPSRFWFVPEDMRFKRGDDLLLFDSGRMTIQTEYLSNSPTRKADPANEKFADFFTEHYEEISTRYPVYKELFDYAKMVSLAKYLKEQGIPLFWFLMANKDLVLTEDAPGTVDELVKPSDHFRDITISGGVDLGFDVANQGNYVYDQDAIIAINEARTKYADNRRSTTSVSYDRKTTKTGADPFSFKLGENNYTVVPQHSLTSGKDRRGIRYQTDMAVSGRGLQLTQDALNQIETELVYRQTQEDMVLILRTMEKHNLDEEEIIALYKVKKKKAMKRVAKLIAQLGNLKNEKYTDREMFIEAVSQSIGNEKTKLFEKLIMKYAFYSTSLELVRYFDPDMAGVGEFGDGWKLLVPYQILDAGQGSRVVSGVPLPRRIILVHALSGVKEKLQLTEKGNDIHYFVEDSIDSQVVKLEPMTDGTYRLIDKIGNKFEFNNQGYLTDMIFSADHHIRYEYVEGLTESFDKNPYSVKPHGKALVDFLNMQVPKQIEITDHIHDNREILIFGSLGDYQGYIPENDKKSVVKIAVFMTDGSLRIVDKKGQETILTVAGTFKGMLLSDDRPMIKAITQGEHTIRFKYTIDQSANVIIAKAEHFQRGQPAPSSVVAYHYDNQGRLSNVDKTGSALAHRKGDSKSQVIASTTSN